MLNNNIPNMRTASVRMLRSDIRIRIYIRGSLRAGIRICILYIVSESCTNGINFNSYNT